MAVLVPALLKAAVYSEKLCQPPAQRCLDFCHLKVSQLVQIKPHSSALGVLDLLQAEE